MSKIQRLIHGYLKPGNVLFLIFLLPLVTNPWGSVSPSEFAKVSFLMLYISGAFFYFALKTLYAKRIKDIYSWPVAIGIFLILFSLVFSTIHSIAPLQSFWGTYERFQGLITKLLVLVFFVLCLNFFKTEERRKSLWNITKIVGALVSVLGIIQYFTQDFSDPFGSGQLFAGRIFGTLGNPNDLGQYLIFPIIAALIGLSEYKNRRSIVFNASCVILTLTALFLSQNRASILAVFIVSAIFLISIIKSKKIKWSVFLSFFAILIIFAGIAFGNARSFKTRVVLWQSTMESVSKNPWFGTGLETYTQAIQENLSPKLYQTEKLDQIPDNPHNETLSILYSQGILGLSVFLFILIYLIFRIFSYAKKRRLAASSKIAIFSLLATLIASQFGFNLITQEIFIAVSFAILVLDVFEFTEIEISIGMTKKIAIFIIFFSLSAILIALPVKLLKADMNINKAVADTFENREKGLKSFSEIIEDSPPFAYLYRTVFTFFGQDLDTHPEYYAALKWMNDKHIELTGYDFETLAERGTLAYAIGDTEQANMIYGSVLKKYPAALRAFSQWAKLAYRHKDYAAAYKASGAYIENAPVYWKFRENLKSHTKKEQEQYRIFMKSNWGFDEILEINKASKELLGD
jgi:O-antigen ligase